MGRTLPEQDVGSQGEPVISGARKASGEDEAQSGLSPLGPTVIEWMPVRRRSANMLAAAPVADAPELELEEVVESGAPAEPAGASEGALAYFGLHEGSLVDRTYRVERALGVGGMGVVALAHDERLDRKVAIKLIKPDLFAFPEMRTFFHNEARAMARVQHPNVLTIYSFGEHESTPFFIMEYVDGYTAEQWLKSREPGTFPDVDTAMKILEQACRGVEAIHATSTVHRDLKPSNLLIDKSFRVAVGDLGVARILESASNGNVIVGSSSYMAPEAALGEDEAPDMASRRDIYALGCLAYEFLTGRTPFVGNTDMTILSQHVLQEPLPPSAIRPTLPRGYDEVILRALAKDPRARWPTVSAFRRALAAEHSGNREPDRILIADDDPDWRTIIHSSLTARFPHAVVDQVGDGEAALAAFEKNPYSVVLVDLEMPEIDGAKLTLLLRSLDGASRTPIIVLTAAGGPREWQRLSAIGADAFLVKPVNADDVEMLIRRTLRSRAASMPPTSGA